MAGGAHRLKPLRTRSRSELAPKPAPRRLTRSERVSAGRRQEPPSLEARCPGSLRRCPHLRTHWSRSGRGLSSGQRVCHPQCRLRDCLRRSQFGYSRRAMNARPKRFPDGDRLPATGDFHGSHDRPSPRPRAVGHRKRRVASRRVEPRPAMHGLGRDAQLVVAEVVMTANSNDFGFSARLAGNRLEPRLGQFALERWRADDEDPRADSLAFAYEGRKCASRRDDLALVCADTERSQPPGILGTRAPGVIGEEHQTSAAGT
jgi:hypothetical protein